MKIYGLLFLVIGLTSNAMNQVIQNEADLKKVYAKIATRYWQPTTITYMAQYPDKPKSLILKRYVEMFASRALRHRNPSQNIQLVSAEVHVARNFTPSTIEEYKYIIKGKQYGGIAAVVVCTYKWNEKFKEIEEDIKKKSEK